MIKKPRERQTLSACHTHAIRVAHVYWCKDDVYLFIQWGISLCIHLFILSFLLIDWLIDWLIDFFVWLIDCCLSVCLSLSLQYLNFMCWKYDSDRVSSFWDIASENQKSGGAFIRQNMVIKFFQDISTSWTPFTCIFKELSNDTKHMAFRSIQRWLFTGHHVWINPDNMPTGRTTSNIMCFFITMNPRRSQCESLHQTNQIPSLQQN